MFEDYPESITITSTGPAAEKQLMRMGRYILEADKAAQNRPVYKKRDSDDYIYFSRKLNTLLYVTLVITGSVIFLIAGFGKWMVDDDITDNFSLISTEKRGLLAIPTSGWQYWDEVTGTWKADPGLMFIHK